MSIAMRVLLIVGSLMTAVYVLRRVRKSRMRTEDSAFWLVFSLILVLMGLLPDLVTRLAGAIGVLSAANLVFSPAAAGDGYRPGRGDRAAGAGNGEASGTRGGYVRGRVRKPERNRKD